MHKINGGTVSIDSLLTMKMILIYLIFSKIYSWDKKRYKTGDFNQKSDIQLVGVTKVENRYCSFRGNYQRHKIRIHHLGIKEYSI